MFNKLKKFFRINLNTDYKLEILRKNQKAVIPLSMFDKFNFENNDKIQILPNSYNLIKTPEGNSHIYADGVGYRIPSEIELVQFMGYDLPHHLVKLTGAGIETFDELGRGHLKNYIKYIGLKKNHNFLEIACGMGRDAFQLKNFLSKKSYYYGIDVQRESIVWLNNNLSRDYPNFKFLHFDVKHELHNPFGKYEKNNIKFPIKSNSIDSIGLQSLITHIFEEEVVHYFKQIRRVLKKNGKAYVTFLLYSDEIVEASRKNNCTPYGLRFEHKYADGCYINNLQYPTGGVAYTEEAMLRMIRKSGLKLVRPFLKGYWSGFHKKPDSDGQDVAILTPA